ASPQVSQTSEGRRVEEDWGTCWEPDTLRDAPSGRDRTRLRQPCLPFLNMISCYDTVFLCSD
uniref:Uncharacterized protein n=1 Tax=Acanthochromis polyacanthus TaxID=80966 RepID=A0A3Q1F3S4_9TELE